MYPKLRTDPVGWICCYVPFIGLACLGLFCMYALAVYDPSLEVAGKLNLPHCDCPACDVVPSGWTNNAGAPRKGHDYWQLMLPKGRYEKATFSAQGVLTELPDMYERWDYPAPTMPINIHGKAVWVHVFVEDEG